MKIIGITGPSGSGKSLISDHLKKFNITVIDADEVYHSLLIPPSDCLRAIRESFGDAVFNDDGTLSRPSLASVVFNDKEKLELLNRTVLIFVLDRIRELIRALSDKGVTLVAVDAPTLIESGFNKECDIVVSVLCPPKTRIERIIKRDKISFEAAKERTDAQKPDSFYVNASDIIIENIGDMDDLSDELLKIISIITNE